MYIIYIYYCFSGISIYRRYSTMVRQVFIGPLIHTDDNEELIIKKNVAVFIEDGKVFDTFHIYIFYYIYMSVCV